MISDLEDGTYSEIPLEWGRILEKQRIFIMDEKDLDNSISSIGDKEMISFLVDNNFAIITSFKPSFLGYNFENYNIPFYFETLIVDSSSEKNVLETLSYLPSQRLSRYIQFRFFFECNELFIRNVLQIAIRKGYFNIEFVFNYDRKENINAYSKIIAENMFYVSRIVIMNSRDQFINEQLILNEKKLVDSQMCGLIDETLLCVNLDTYAKYVLGNNCLWKKIAIDIDGNIKNCPSMDFTYGNIKNTDLISVLTNTRYLFFSGLRRIHIMECCKCHLAAFCIDCRGNLPICRIFEKPIKCLINIS